ncbi:MAG: sulfatase-like hydrolase/transferase [Acidobacteriia bacterium]|nr:sulfatase-like hydrolase/transferase [Terriglobia bacterium]
MAVRETSRRNFLKKTAATAAAAAGMGTRPTAAVAEETPRPEECGSIWERPPKQKGNNLNLIVIVSDTFRHDNLTCYGKKWIESLETPNLDRFADECVVFKDAYPEGMPTVVIRRTLYAGRRVIPCHFFRQHEPVQLPGWHNLYNEDQTLSETLNEAGYITALVSDLPHEQRPGRNFHRGFNMYQWIRGQEVDSYGTSPHKLLDVSDMVSSEYLASMPNLQSFLSQYKANRNLWKQEGESLSELVARVAIRWIKSNFDQRPFYLHVEMFDPHEPWDPPERFLDKYWRKTYTPSFLEPPYATSPLSEEIKQRFRANYAGEVSCVDYWIGELLDAVKQYGLLENTVVVFMADHGAMLGEHGQFLKGPDKLRGQVTHVPLMIRTPDRHYAGKKVSGFVQIHDVMPTVLHLLDLKPPKRVTGENAWNLVTGATRSLRDYVVQTYGWVGVARDQEWNYSEIWKPEARQDKFSVRPGAPETFYKPQLYNLAHDPEELTDVADQYPDICSRMSAKLKEYIAAGRGLTYGSFNQKASLSTGEVYIKESH